MEPETRNEKIIRELNLAEAELSLWGHTHTFLAGLAIGTVLGIIIKWVVF